METNIESLGPARFRSPLHRIATSNVHFRTDAERVLMDDTYSDAFGVQDHAGKVSFEIAGPREHIFFDPPPTTAGIVTCGGLCPGLNDIIRGLVMELTHRYGVTKVYGFRYGYEGLVPRYGQTPMVLKPDSLDAIHAFGGSILGTSRGPQDVPEMVNFLEEMEVDILFVVGGDGSLRGANEISLEIRRRGQLKSVIGIPKTIDNDIMYLDKSFGFETAFAEAVKAVSCAHVESLGSRNGIGLVKPRSASISMARAASSRHFTTASPAANTPSSSSRKAPASTSWKAPATQSTPPATSAREISACS